MCEPLAFLFLILLILHFPQIQNRLLLLGANAVNLACLAVNDP